MKLINLLLFLFSCTVSVAQPKYNIDLTNWKLELPSGYTASEWKLSNFEKDRFAKPFFYVDPDDKAFVFEAYPVEGTSTAQYTKNMLREQMKPGSSSVNWTLERGGTLEADFQVVEVSKEGRNYHEILLFQIQGRTSDEQTETLGLDKNTGPPFIKIFWDNGEIKVVRKVLKDFNTLGNALLMKDAWKDDKDKSFRRDIDFERAKIRITAKKGKVEMQLNNQRPIVFDDINVKQWYFENYFVAGNYLQTKEQSAKSIVKFYDLQVHHD